MCGTYKIHFVINPSIELVLLRLKEYSGLDLDISRDDNNNVEIQHPTSSRHSIDLSFIKKGIYFDGALVIESDRITINTFTPELNYLEGITLAVLMDLGGKIELEWSLPAWAHLKWQGERWWKEVGPKRPFLARIIEKLF